MQKYSEDWQSGLEPVLDIRTVTDLGEAPLGIILEAAYEIERGHTFAVISTSEPDYLYKALGKRGFSHAAEHVGTDEWIVRFTRNQVS